MSSSQYECLQEKTMQAATRNNRPWTEEEDKLLLKVGETLEMKAILLGRTYAAVAARHARLMRGA